jgi:hypothetical protein
MDNYNIQQKKSNVKIFTCGCCNYNTSRAGFYERHLKTKKHEKNSVKIQQNTITIQHESQSYICECGKSYNHRASLYNHKKICNGEVNQKPKTISKKISNDEVIENLTKENREMKSMFMMMLEKYQETQLENMKVMKDNQEMVNKFIEAIPQCGNINNTYIEKQTLNFYLTNTCKNAESIHDFTDRYVKRCVEFFENNYREVAYNQISLASNVYDIFFKCLTENPQNLNFVQTTDVKNGVLYVKEKKKDENWQLQGEAEFIKYIDGFEKAGLNISHAINKAFHPLQQEFNQRLIQECGAEPKEDDYTSEDGYEKDLNMYKEKVGEYKCNLLTQVFDTARLFDNNTRRTEILSKTKRIKE